MKLKPDDGNPVPRSRRQGGDAMRHNKKPWLESYDEKHRDPLEGPRPVTRLEALVAVMIFAALFAFGYGAIAGFTAQNDRRAMCASKHGGQWINGECREVVK